MTDNLKKECLLKKMAGFYGDKVKVEDGSYPWMDRAVSYGGPVALAVAGGLMGLRLDSGYAKDMQGKGLELAGSLLGSLGIFGVSQYLITMGFQPAVNSMSDGVVKTVADLVVKALDGFNNLLPLMVVRNALPTTLGDAKIAVAKPLAFKAMSQVLKGIEKDMASKYNGEDYTPSFAGPVYGSLLAGVLSKTACGWIEDGMEASEGAYGLMDHNGQLVLDKEGKPTSLNVGSELITNVVDSFLFANLKKVLLGESYKPEEVKEDIVNGITTSFAFATRIGTLDKYSGFDEYYFFKNILPLAAANWSYQVGEALIEAFGDGSPLISESESLNLKGNIPTDSL